MSKPGSVRASSGLSIVDDRLLHDLSWRWAKRFGRSMWTEQDLYQEAVKVVLTKLPKFNPQRARANTFFTIVIRNHFSHLAEHEALFQRHHVLSSDL